MNKAVRALKLYAEAAAHPFVIGFGLFLMIGMALAFIIDPDPVGGDEYLSMLGAVQMGNMGVILMVFAASTKLQQNKFFSSCTCAKELFTIGPVVAVTILCVLYDTLLDVSAYINLGTQGLADTLVFNTVSSMLLIIVGGCYGKKGVPLTALLLGAAYFTFLGFPMASKITNISSHIIGLSLTTAVIIAVCGYTFAIAFTLMIENIWWKKGNRFAPNKFIQNALEVQENE
ncbi:hypothetical protein [Ruminococcus sp. NK3A76]|uniref:hypothetical protein n=1 Tax=Ruminococcus sp. NK3A76 TaxID=877411 RepID=UPI00048F47FE|nr:hypothetical protein [Ruminococcus sp. NK3A76]